MHGCLRVKHKINSFIACRSTGAQWMVKISIRICPSIKPPPPHTALTYYWFQGHNCNQKDAPRTIIMYYLKATVPSFVIHEDIKEWNKQNAPIESNCYVLCRNVKCRMAINRSRSYKPSLSRSIPLLESNSISIYDNGSSIESIQYSQVPTLFMNTQIFCSGHMNGVLQELALVGSAFRPLRINGLFLVQNIPKLNIHARR